MPQGLQRGPGADPAAAPSESRLAAALTEKAGIADGRLPGAYKDEKDGHAGCPWRSAIRRDGFEDVKGGRHPSYADAALRILEVYQAHPPYVEEGRFTLAAGKHADLGIDMGPHMPTAPENLSRAFLMNYDFWADYRDDLDAKFQAWLAK